MTSAKMGTLRVKGQVIQARTQGETLRILIQPTAGKEVICVSSLIRDAIGEVKKPKKGITDRYSRHIHIGGQHDDHFNGMLD